MQYTLVVTWKSFTRVTGIIMTYPMFCAQRPANCKLWDKRRVDTCCCFTCVNMKSLADMLRKVCQAFQIILQPVGDREGQPPLSDPDKFPVADLHGAEAVMTGGELVDHFCAQANVDKSALVPPATEEVNDHDLPSPEEEQAMLDGGDMGEGEDDEDLMIAPESFTESINREV